jgi:hypothetical protein
MMAQDALDDGRLAVTLVTNHDDLRSSNLGVEPGSKNKFVS